jgi:hypothetical protein
MAGVCNRLRFLRLKPLVRKPAHIVCLTNPFSYARRLLFENFDEQENSLEIYDYILRAFS